MNDGQQHPSSAGRLPYVQLPREFFARPTVTVARELIGKYLVRQVGSVVHAARIIETEAYVGAQDKACHASKGRTPRTEVLFGPPGHAYVYLCYGLHELLNVVTEREDFPAAVLLRAIELDGRLIDGPGRLTRALTVTRDFNRHDLTAGTHLWFEDRGEGVPPRQVQALPRIGVAYAGAWAKKPWRFRWSRAVSPSRRRSSSTASTPYSPAQ